MTGRPATLCPASLLQPPATLPHVHLAVPEQTSWTSTRSPSPKSCDLRKLLAFSEMKVSVLICETVENINLPRLQLTEDVLCPLLLEIKGGESSGAALPEALWNLKHPEWVLSAQPSPTMPHPAPSPHSAATGQVPGG